MMIRVKKFGPGLEWKDGFLINSDLIVQAESLDYLRGEGFPVCRVKMLDGTYYLLAGTPDDFCRDVGDYRLTSDVPDDGTRHNL